MTNHTTALAAVRRCARRPEKQGASIEDVADEPQQDEDAGLPFSDGSTFSDGSGFE